MKKEEFLALINASESEDFYLKKDFIFTIKIQSDLDTIAKALKRCGIKADKSMVSRIFKIGVNLSEIEKLNKDAFVKALSEEKAAAEQRIAQLLGDLKSPVAPAPLAKQPEEPRGGKILNEREAMIELHNMLANSLGKGVAVLGKEQGVPTQVRYGGDVGNVRNDHILESIKHVCKQMGIQYSEKTVNDKKLISILYDENKPIFANKSSEDLKQLLNNFLKAFQAHQAANPIKLPEPMIFEPPKVKNAGKKEKEKSKAKPEELKKQKKSGLSDIH